ncbi:MAG: hypothetical protein U0414_34295 [Polyangiaceae bacterium]
MARASTTAVLKIVLPLVGLSLLPLAGLVYAATASFGPKARASSSASAVVSSKKPAAKPADDMEDEGAPGAEPKPAGPTPVAKPTALGKLGANSRAPQHTLCCEKLSDMGQSASPKDKATLLAAASACSAAPSFEGALKQVASIVDGAVDLPSECQKR